MNTEPEKTHENVTNPATGEVVAPVRQHTRAQAEAWLARLRETAKEQARLSWGERRRYAKAVQARLAQRKREVAETISRCTGKTYADALATEVVPSVVAAGYYGKTARRVLRPRRLRRSSIMFLQKSSVEYREPYGVVGIITPWNYPFAIPFHEVMQALLSGNTVALKVATQVQPVGELLVKILHEAGLQDGVLSLMHVPGRTAAELFLAGGVDKLFFTGSTSVGRSLMEQAAQSLTPVSLELGGNDAMIVLEDAHVTRAAAGAIWAGISNAGQSCGAVERVYVADSVYERFVGELRRLLRELEVGDPSRPNADLGSLSTPDQRQTVIEHVEDARRRGARVLQAGRFSAGDGRSGRDSPKDPGTGHGGLYYPPTLIEGATPEMRCMQDETFGPVLALRKVTGAEEAVTEANQSPYGLTASVWSRDRRRAASVAAQLHAGAVTINDHLMSHGMPETAWGGYKYSGIGRTHGAEGFREMTRTKTVVRDRAHWMRTNLWWHPYNRRLVRGLEGAVDGVLHPAGIGLIRRIRGLGKLLRLVLGRLRR